MEVVARLPGETTVHICNLSWLHDYRWLDSRVLLRACVRMWSGRSDEEGTCHQNISTSASQNGPKMLPVRILGSRPKMCPHPRSQKHVDAGAIPINESALPCQSCVAGSYRECRQLAAAPIRCVGPACQRCRALPASFSCWNLPAASFSAAFFPPLFPPPFSRRCFLPRSHLLPGEQL
jgi:hypothetical protein